MIQIIPKLFEYLCSPTTYSNSSMVTSFSRRMLVTSHQNEQPLLKAVEFDLSTLVSNNQGNSSKYPHVSCQLPGSNVQLTKGKDENNREERHKHSEQSSSNQKKTNSWFNNWNFSLFEGSENSPVNKDTMQEKKKASSRNPLPTKTEVVHLFCDNVGLLSCVTMTLVIVTAVTGFWGFVLILCCALLNYRMRCILTKAFILLTMLMSRMESWNLKYDGDIDFQINGKLKFELSLNTNPYSTIHKGTFENKEDVAVRLIPLFKYGTRNEAFKRRCYLQEKDIHKLINNDSENIVRYVCSEKVYQSGLPYIAMAFEYCEWNLDDLITEIRHHKCDPYNSREAGLHLLKALDFLHERSLIHRDIHPRNILVKKVGEEYKFKISDMSTSVSKLQKSKVFLKVHGLLQTDNTFGRVGWLAPEIYDSIGRNVKTNYTHEADVFAMGLVLYFVHTQGYKLFNDQGSIQIEDSNLSLNAHDPIGNLVQRMTTTAPGERLECKACLRHPGHWDFLKILNFYKMVSDKLMLLQTWPQLGMSYFRLGSLVETNSQNVMQGKDWAQKLCPVVKAYLFPANSRAQRAKYNITEVKGILRAIRNTKDHFDELPMNVKASLGGSLETLLDYWSSRFPYLLIHVHEAVKMLPIPDFKSYV